MGSDAERGGVKRSIFIGWEMREAAAYAVARHSIRKHLSQPIPVKGLILEQMQEQGLYSRPIRRIPRQPEQQAWDIISDAPMSTSFAVSRFLTPHLAKSGWALFMDCDFLVRADLNELFDSLDPRFAVYCVKHDYRPKDGLKMDSQLQVAYARKLWSSFCVFNVNHPANKALTLEMINSVPGRDLHAFSWLKDVEIGDLGEEWNWIPNYSPTEIEPKAIHFTEGGPWFNAYSDVDFAEEWRRAVQDWAA